MKFYFFLLLLSYIYTFRFNRHKNKVEDDHEELLQFHNIPTKKLNEIQHEGYKDISETNYEEFDMGYQPDYLPIDKR